MDTTEIYYATIADAMWTAFTESEKTGVRFGLFPAAAMARAEREVLATCETFDGHALVLALMNRAKTDGGMRA